MRGDQMSDWQSGFVEANGIRLHYTRTGGSKPGLVLAHGVTDAGLSWTPVARALESDYDVIMVDARGHGLSDAPETGYGPAEQAADLVGVIRELGLRKPAILGHSMGAATTLYLAGAYPDIPGVILLEDPPPWWMRRDEEASGQDAEAVKRARLEAHKGKPREQLIAEQRAARPAWSDAELGPWADAKMAYNPRALAVYDPATHAGIEWFRLLRAVSCPALLITADTDRASIVSAGAAAALQAVVPRMRVTHIPGAGHNIRREAFERYLEVVRAFLAAPPVGPIVSPEVRGDGHVTFRLSAPYASDARLGGQWLPAGAEPIAMEQGLDGVWSATVGPLSPDFYEYSFVLDGLRILDPLNRDVSVNPHSPRSFAFVAGHESEFMAVKPVPHGAVATLWYHSDALDAERRLHVYTPPDYGKSDQAFPVLYLMHGGGGIDSDWSSQGRAGFILDNLLAEGKIRPMIVVMPDGNVGTGMMKMHRPGTDPFGPELVDSVIPLIERQYRTVSGRAGRALGGLSMGGLQTLNVGLENPELFCGLVVMSSGWFPAELAAVSQDPSFAAAVAASPFDLFWVGVGRDDVLAYQNSRGMLGLFESLDIPVTYNESDGGHTWHNWRVYLAEVAPKLFGGVAVNGFRNGFHG